MTMNTSNPHGTSLVVLIWVLTGISVIVVSLRVLAKTKIRQFRTDDVVMIFALILGIIAGSLNTTAVKYGYGLPDESVPEPGATTGRKFYIIGLAFLILCTAVGRAAFVLYLLAILGGQKWQRIILTALAVMEVVFNSVSIILMFASCTPVSMLWDYAAEGTCAADSIQVDFGYFQSVFNIFVDLYLAVVPTYIFWHLNLKLGIKISLVALMSGGLVAMAAALAKTIQLPEIHNDALGGTINLLRWGYIEANLVMITASLPCLRSLILSGFHYMTSSGHRSRSYELGAAAFTGTRAGTTSVTAQKTSHRKTDSRLRGMLSTRNRGDDGASVDRILGSRNSLDGVETGGSSQEGSAGIRKHVEVTVVADDGGKGV
ncbi:uncharacterized protein NFIA_050810 [Aspergillus fischeri NRRL 181]|uniref:Rhodopsin domain-containing protein n=1 Tax=Neosartorya fischeri (strain ATCC 1020 / DSM 3700 / CBS 544.65 / FGSC A1164 / JCM 1740 / NRRL 181 / WB 181) TaxID=331117 RepID=A1DLR5_NEOFI|nr:conserved hypothetical protein [Aspergillus fischeri NRRL 181]EAW15736.1 conserved hypothetical protein [Aspergillus fischeri NRRL 181]KAG2025995.1 hypothetical protein GB937_002138 [Aspergillus fischeri]